MEINPEHTKGYISGAQKTATVFVVIIVALVSLLWQANETNKKLDMEIYELKNEFKNDTIKRSGELRDITTKLLACQNENNSIKQIKEEKRQIIWIVSSHNKNKELATSLYRTILTKGYINVEEKSNEFHTEGKKLLTPSIYYRNFFLKNNPTIKDLKNIGEEMGLIFNTGITSKSTDPIVEEALKMSGQWIFLIVI